LKSLTQSGWR